MVSAGMALCAGREDGGAAVWGCSPGLGSPLLPQAPPSKCCWAFISSFWVAGRGWAEVLVYDNSCSLIRRKTSIYQLPHDVIVALEEKVLSVLTQMECVCF